MRGPSVLLKKCRLFSMVGNYEKDIFLVVIGEFSNILEYPQIPLNILKYP